MKSVKNLLNASNDKKFGNHQVEHAGKYRYFIYFWTTIVTVNDEDKTFFTDNGGYNTPSTNRTINAYRRELESLGYIEINK